MKTLISFCMVMMIMLVACTKDQFVQDETLMLKKAKVPVPMKADFCMTAASNPDPNAPYYIPVSGAPGGFQIPAFPVYGKISGHATHMGQINSELSYGIITKCDYIDNAPSGISPNDEIWMENHGRITAANGDSYAFIHSTPIVVKLDLFLSGNPILPFSGEVTMSDGTGRFEGATGTVIMVGQTDMTAGTNCWKADGFLEFEN